MSVDTFTIERSTTFTTTEEIATYWTEQISDRKDQYPKLQKIVFNYYVKKERRPFDFIFRKHPLIEQQYSYEDCFGLTIFPKGTMVNDIPIPQTIFTIVLSDEKNLWKFLEMQPVDTKGERIGNRCNSKWQSIIDLDPGQIVSITLKK